MEKTKKIELYIMLLVAVIGGAATIAAAFISRTPSSKAESIAEVASPIEDFEVPQVRERRADVVVDRDPNVTPSVKNNVGPHSQVIFSNPDMKQYAESHLQPPVNNERDSVASRAPDWAVVGYWDYDGVDGQYLSEGLESINQPGSNASQTWKMHLQLKAHDRLPRRVRSLWPVKMSMVQKKICINVPNYPTYSAFIDFPGDENDGVFTFQNCL